MFYCSYRRVSLLYLQRQQVLFFAIAKSCLYSSTEMILTVEGAFSILGGVSSHYRDELDKE